jgi:hypothetical protein
MDRVRCGDGVDKITKMKEIRRYRRSPQGKDCSVADKQVDEKIRYKRERG